MFTLRWECASKEDSERGGEKRMRFLAHWDFFSVSESVAAETFCSARKLVAAISHICSGSEWAKAFCTDLASPVHSTKNSNCCNIHSPDFLPDIVFFTSCARPFFTRTENVALLFSPYSSCFLSEASCPVFSTFELLFTFYL